MITDFYRFLYLHYKKKEDDFMSWYYTLSIIGFLLTLNVGSLIHLYLAKYQISLDKLQYLMLFLTPWILHFIYFYAIDKKRKNELLKEKSKVVTKSKVGFFAYIIVSKIVFFYTLITWADSLVK